MFTQIIQGHLGKHHTHSPENVFIGFLKQILLLTT